MLPRFWEIVAEVRTYRPRPLDVLGLVLTMYDGREAIQRQVAEALAGDPLLFETVIPRSASALADTLYHAPVAVYQPRAALAAAYGALAAEVRARLEGLPDA